MAITIGDAILWLRADKSRLGSDLDRAEQETRGWGARLGAGLKRVVGGAVVAAAAAATTAIAGVGIAAVGAARSGLSFNNSMEQVTAKLNAFTKDSAKSAEILEMIRVRASRTPFAFEAMANATAGLMPVARSANIELESLVETAEVLAASNPAEGLEGAAFALREAVSGDFTSIIERFNLPRQMINQLRAEGLPDIEVVRRAMLAMGYDTDLVAGLAETAAGRWDTFQDTLTNLAGIATRPIFDRMSAGLGRLSEYLSRDDVAERIEGIAGAIGDRLGGAIDWLVDTAAPRLADGVQAARDTVTTFRQALAGEWMDDESIQPLHRLAGVIGSQFAPGGQIRDAIVTFRQALAGEWMDDESIQPLHRLAGIIGTALAEGVPRVAEGFRSLVEAIGPFLDEHGDRLLNLLLGIGVALAAFAVISTVVGWITGLVAAWGALSAGVTAAGGIFAAIVAVLGGPLTLAIAAVAAVIGVLAVAWANDWGGIREKTASAVEFIKGIISRGLEAIQQFWDTHGEQIKLLISTAWEAIKLLFSSALEGIRQVLEVFRLAREGEWYEFGQKLREIWDTLWANIRTILETAIETLVELVGRLTNEMRQAFTNVDWGAVGSSIIDGIINGITSGVGRLVEAAASAARAAYEAVRGFLDSRSPSRKFIPVGGSMPEGMAIGARRKAGEAVAAMRDVAQAALRGAEGALGNVAVRVPALAGVAQGWGVGGTSTHNSRHVVFESGSIVVNGGDGKDVEQSLLKALTARGY